jgi:hypothetical protein
VIPLLKAAWRTLWHDEQFAKRLARGLLIGCGAGSVGLAAMLSGRWAVVAYVTGGIAGVIGGMISVGQMNPTDAGTTAAVDRDLATVGERKVVEPGPVIPAGWVGRP